MFNLILNGVDVILIVDTEYSVGLKPCYSPDPCISDSKPHHVAGRLFPSNMAS